MRRVMFMCQKNGKCCVQMQGDVHIPVSGNVCPRDEKVRWTLAWLCKSSVGHTHAHYSMENMKSESEN